MLNRSIAYGLALSALVGCSSDVSTCVPGSTNACLCVAGNDGIQTCQPDGTYSACECATVDAGPESRDASTPRDAGSPADAGTADAGAGADDAGTGTEDAGAGSCVAPLADCGGRCVDTSTDEANCGACGEECAAGSFCVMGECEDVGACPAPFVMCDADCVDPRSNATYCGASGDCTGGDAGSACPGACLDGRCVFESCAAAARAGASTGDGVYLVDIDGSGGPLPPQNVYCDMTTAGGGWMLVYKIRNDVPDIADPWWAMVALGSGTALPTTPSPIPPGAHFEGPIRETRQAHRSTMASAQYRGTAITPSGTVILDLWNSNQGGDAIGRAASGGTGTPELCSFAVHATTVISAQPSTGLSAGNMVEECFRMTSSGSDVVLIQDETTTTTSAILGDATIANYSSGAFINSTTLIWIRPYAP